MSGGVLDCLRDALARIVAARENFEDGDHRLAELALYDLEEDLAALVYVLELEPAA